MSKQLFSREFTIEAPSIPQGVFEAFVSAQAKLLSLRGFIEKTANGFKGYLEGEKETMERVKQLIEKAEPFLTQIKVLVFTELKEIKKYTIENFNVKK